MTENSGDSTEQLVGAEVRLHPRLARPAVTVVGGTYLDVELMVDGHIRGDVSLEVWRRSSALGGPGFCYAMELARCGIGVELITGLGSCQFSELARGTLRDHGITGLALAEAAEAALDVATLVIDPAGRKLAFNEHRLARTLKCPPSALSRGTPLLVASPTPLAAVVSAIRACSMQGWIPELFFAPHSQQVAEFARMPESLQEMLCGAITVACLNAEDLTPDLESALGGSRLLVATRGASGCAVRMDGGGWTSFPAHSVHPPRLNTNGAGEAFFSGLLVAWLRGAAAEHAIQKGLQSAAQHLIHRQERSHRGETSAAEPSHTIPKSMGDESAC